MFNEFFFLQLALFFNIYFYIYIINILNLWYLGGLYLFFSGFDGLIDDLDILVGFLWVIDLGVGLIFFLFILHFSNFLHQKNLYNTTNRLFYFLINFVLFYCMFNYTFSFNNFNLSKYFNNLWFWDISWYNYYHFFNTAHITDLNLLREIYFYSLSSEFIIINFMLLYGLFISILFIFLIKRIFNILTFAQIFNTALISTLQTFVFIRNQNFIKQQNTSIGTRVWKKNKNLNLNGF